MKKIIITESQYKRLFGTVITESDSFENDLDGKMLKRYSRNNPDHVKSVQKILISLGYDLGNYGLNKDGVDGIYGPTTADAVKEFQKEVFPKDSNEWDGVVGPKTYEKLLEKSKDDVIYSDDELEDEEDDVIYSDDEYNTEDYYGLGDKIVNKASERLGEPYSWGDEFCTKGGDCSGLIDWTFSQIPELDSPGRDTTRTLMKEKGFIKGSDNYTEVKKGDVLLFDGESYNHTGFVYNVNGDKIDMIHSAGKGWDEGSERGVQITKDIFNRYDYWEKWYQGYIPYEYFIVDDQYQPLV